MQEITIDEQNVDFTLQPIMQGQQPMMLGQQPMMQGQQPMMQGQQPMMQGQQPMMQGQQPMMQGQQPMMQGQQPMMMVPVNPVNFMNAQDKLLSMKGIFIKQKINMLQVATGFETKNQYMVYGATESGDIDKNFPLFKAKEQSSFCARQWCAPKNRPFEMNVWHDSNTQITNQEGQMAFKYEREYVCTCLCLNRPILNVYSEEGGQKTKIGYATNQFVLCDEEIEVYDRNNNLKYIISGDCCQWGICCQCPCDTCQNVDFKILDSLRNPKSTLQKRTKGCAASAVSDAVNLSLQFPDDATGEDRALLLAASIMLDYTYFEEQPQGGRNNQFNNGF